MALIHGIDADDLGVRLSLLRASVAASRAGECWAAHDAVSGEPVAVFGVAPTSWIDNEAAPWLLGTEELPRYGRDLVAMGRDAVSDWSQRWRLVNRVDARTRRRCAGCGTLGSRWKGGTAWSHFGSERLTAEPPIRPTGSCTGRRAGAGDVGVNQSNVAFRPLRRQVQHLFLATLLKAFRPSKSSHAANNRSHVMPDNRSRRH